MKKRKTKEKKEKGQKSETWIKGKICALIRIMDMFMTQ